MYSKISKFKMQPLPANNGPAAIAKFSQEWGQIERFGIELIPATRIANKTSESCARR